MGLALGLLLACGGVTGDSGDTGDTGTVVDTGPCPSESLRTWDNTGGPFLLTWCAPCHSAALPQDQRQGAPLGVDLDTHEGALAWADRIRVRTLETADMPPVGEPEAEDLAGLAEWLDCGLP